MKILNCTTKFYAPSHTFITSVIDSQVENGDEVSVFTKELLHNREGCDVFDVSVDTLPPIIHNIQRRLNVLNGRSRYVNFQRAKSLLAKITPDIAHCHFGPSATYFHEIQKYAKTRIPMVVSLHGYDVFLAQEIEENYEKRIKEVISRDSVLFTVPSNYLRNLAISNLGIPESKVVVLHNSFNEKLFCPMYKETRQDEVIKISNVSRFISWKGQRYLIEAVKLMVEQGMPNIQVNFVGDGIELENCKRLASELGVSGNCVFHGAVSHNDVATIVGDSHIYVHTAIVGENGQTETFGVAILEAIAMGKPVVYFKAGGIDEVFGSYKSSCYVGVEEKNSDSLAEKIKILINDISKIDFFELDKIKGKVTQQYSNNKIKKRIYELYEKLT